MASFAPQACCAVLIAKGGVGEDEEVGDVASRQLLLGLTGS